MLKQLFIDGFSFDSFIQIASPEEKDLIKEVKGNIKFSEEILNKIKKVEKEVNIIASVETWCPYARAFITTMNEVIKINSKFRISLVTMGRGFNDLSTVLNIKEEDYVVPTAVILDGEYEVKDSFIAYPEVYHENGFKGERKNYFNGEKADIILEDVLKKLNLL